MTPEYAAVGLLAHGSLLRHEFLEITGWSEEKADAVIAKLVAEGTVIITSSGNLRIHRYWLAGQLPRHLYEPGPTGQLRRKPKTPPT